MPEEESVALEDQGQPLESPAPEFSFRPTSWLTTPKIGVFDAGGNLLGEIVFDPVPIYFPHGQTLHQMQQEYIDRARARLQERR